MAQTGGGAIGLAEGGREYRHYYTRGVRGEVARRHYSPIFPTRFPWKFLPPAPPPPPSREETRTNPSQTRLNEIEYRGNGFSSIDESRSFIFFSFSFSFASRSILSLSLCVCVSGRKMENASRKTGRQTTAHGTALETTGFTYQR